MIANSNDANRYLDISNPPPVWTTTPLFLDSDPTIEKELKKRIELIIDMGEVANDANSLPFWGMMIEFGTRY